MNLGMDVVELLVDSGADLMCSTKVRRLLIWLLVTE
jgi:hypothetical protein